MNKFKILVTRTECRSTEIEVYQESEDRYKVIDAASAISCDLDFNTFSAHTFDYNFEILTTEEV